MVKASLLLFNVLDFSGVNLLSIRTLTTLTEYCSNLSFNSSAIFTSEPEAKIVKSSPSEIIKPPYKTMLKNNVVSQNKYDNELILLSKNRSDYIRAKTMLERAKEDLSDTVLKSHFNGRLFNVKINQGQFLNSNEKIANIFSTENLEVEFVVPSKIYSNSNDLIGKSIDVLWKGGTTSLKTMKGIIERSDGKTNEEEGGGKLFARIDKFEKRENYIPLGTFVRVDYPVGDFKNVFKLPESSLYTDKVYIVENGIAKPKKIKLIYKGSGYILVDGNLSENDYIITTRIPENLNNQKIKILN